MDCPMVYPGGIAIPHILPSQNHLEHEALTRPNQTRSIPADWERIRVHVRPTESDAGSRLAR